MVLLVPALVLVAVAVARMVGDSPITTFAPPSSTTTTVTTSAPAPAAPFADVRASPTSTPDPTPSMTSPSTSASDPPAAPTAAGRHPTRVVARFHNVNRERRAERLILEGTVRDAAERQAFVDAMSRAWGAMPQGAWPAAGVPKIAYALEFSPQIVDRLVLDEAVGTLEEIALQGELLRDVARAGFVERVRHAFPAARVDDQLVVTAANALEERIYTTLRGRDVAFERDSSRLTPGGKALLDELVPVLWSDPATWIRIEANTHGEGDEASLRRAEARAAAVRQFLVGKGVPADRLIVRGYPAGHPRDRYNGAVVFTASSAPAP
jgi:OOP family OmpA-OmpF porin